jgi:predicted lipoprotein with Yx(FWY)xxD motif
MAWAICLQATNLLWAFLEFEYNRTYIEQNLCVNRFEPAVSCKGFCYLSEKTVEQKDMNDVLAKMKGMETWVFVQQINEIFLCFPMCAAVKIVYPKASDPDTCRGIRHKILRPPIV